MGLAEEVREVGRWISEGRAVQARDKVVSRPKRGGCMPPKSKAPCGRRGPSVRERLDEVGGVPSILLVMMK